MRKTLITIITTILLTACNLPRSVTDQPTSPATDTPANPPCYFNWATQSLPDLSKQVQAAMDSAGLRGITVFAEAFGENCYDSQTNQAVSFGAMETDFRITAKVSNLDDKDDLGNLLEKLMIVLDKFPVGSTPGSQAGLVNVSFQSGDQELNIAFRIYNGKAVRDKGLHGAALLEEFQNK